MVKAGGDTTAVVKDRVKVKEPRKYKVVFYNDDVTPMGFVVEILMVIFKHSESSAVDITMKIHNEGKGIAGVYSYEIADQKATETHALAQTQGYPLRVKVEPE